MPTSLELYKQYEQLNAAGDIEGGIAKLQELIAADESYALAHAALAVALGKVGKHEEAIEHAKRNCELEPNDAFSFTALSVTYQRAYAGTNNMAYIQAAEDAMARSRMIAGM